MVFKPAPVHGASEDRNNEAHKMQIDLKLCTSRKYALDMNMHQFYTYVYYSAQIASLKFYTM